MRPPVEKSAPHGTGFRSPGSSALLDGKGGPYQGSRRRNGRPAIVTSTAEGFSNDSCRPGPAGLESTHRLVPGEVLPRAGVGGYLRVAPGAFYPNLGKPDGEGRPRQQRDPVPPPRVKSRPPGTKPHRSGQHLGGGGPRHP